MPLKFVLTRFRTRSFAAIASFAVLGSSYPGAPVLAQSTSTAAAAYMRSIPLKNGAIETKTYLDQAWEQKVRSGLVANSGFGWDASKREWRMKYKLPEDAVK